MYLHNHEIFEIDNILLFNDNYVKKLEYVIYYFKCKIDIMKKRLKEDILNKESHCHNKDILEYFYRIYYTNEVIYDLFLELDKIYKLVDNSKMIIDLYILKLISELELFNINKLHEIKRIIFLMNQQNDNNIIKNNYIYNTNNNLNIPTFNILNFLNTLLNSYTDIHIKEKITNSIDALLAIYNFNFDDITIENIILLKEYKYELNHNFNLLFKTLCNDIAISIELNYINKIIDYLVINLDEYIFYEIPKLNLINLNYINDLLFTLTLEEIEINISTEHNCELIINCIFKNGIFHIKNYDDVLKINMLRSEKFIITFISEKIIIRIDNIIIRDLFIIQNFNKLYECIINNLFNEIIVIDMIINDYTYDTQLSNCYDILKIDNFLEIFKTIKIFNEKIIKIDENCDIENLICDKFKTNNIVIKCHNKLYLDGNIVIFDDFNLFTYDKKNTNQIFYFEHRLYDIIQNLQYKLHDIFIFYNNRPDQDKNWINYGYLGIPLTNHHHHHPNPHQPTIF
jgi:hypothetical protein